MAQHLRRDDIRILIENLIDSGRCHSVRLTAHKEIRALRVADLKILADCVYRFIIQVLSLSAGAGTVEYERFF